MAQEFMAQEGMAGEFGAAKPARAKAA
jgi:hypothetical protein